LGPGMESKGRAIGLREPQRGSLIPPIEGQTGVGHQLVGSEPGRLLPCKDRGGIPPTHYMVCAAGGDTIRCAPYATFGTQELSDNALAALKDRKACLLAHHGMIAVGDSLRGAMWLAVEVENLAHQYVNCLQLGGEPPLLTPEEVQNVAARIANYGLYSAPK